MKGDVTVLRHPELEPHHQLQFSAIASTRLSWWDILLLCRGYSRRFLSPINKADFIIVWKFLILDRNTRYHITSENSVAVSILLHRCTTWMLTKRNDKKLDANYTRMLRAILIKSWKQLPHKPTATYLSPQKYPSKMNKKCGTILEK